MGKIKKQAESLCYEKVLEVYLPNIFYGTDNNKTKTAAQCVMEHFFPISSYVENELDYETQVESELSYEVVIAREGADELVPEQPAEQTTVDQTGEVEAENQTQEVAENGEVPDNTVQPEPPAAEPAMAFPFSATEKAVDYPIEKLNDFDFLMQNFYSVDSTTTINGSQLNAQNMLAVDMSLTHDASTPQILIYHTHSQEGYVDSNYSDTATTIVGVGEYLAQILREQYGYNVIHDTGTYDVEDHDKAYTVSAPAVSQILTDNPGIEVIIDMHRDGVNRDTKTITNINGMDMAKIMFFNGLSHTTAHGDIEYLANPNLAGNLAFSFQMQLAASEYYPDFSKKIYLKGYRYNMHFLPKSTLVEVGDQNNTYEEAKNAMVPLADVIDKTLRK